MEAEGLIRTQVYASPFGQLVLGAYEDRLCLCNWMEGRRNGSVDCRLRKGLVAEYRDEPSVVVSEAMRQLDEYFLRKRIVFDVPLLFVGTDFQKMVWQKLLEIPYGSTVSYALLAERVGNCNAVRAVANANAVNAISIFVPCHRVIGSDKSLTGYGGGLPAKRGLLELESAIFRR